MSVVITRANHAYQHGIPGFYVVNHETQLAVAGPYALEEHANHAKVEADAPYLGLAPDALRVYEVTAS